MDTLVVITGSTNNLLRHVRRAYARLPRGRFAEWIEILQ